MSETPVAPFLRRAAAFQIANGGVTPETEANDVAAWSEMQAFVDAHVAHGGDLVSTPDDDVICGPGPDVTYRLRCSCGETLVRTVTAWTVVRYILARRQEPVSQQDNEDATSEGKTPTCH